MLTKVLGQIKQARGSRQFLLRGVAKVQGEWALVYTPHKSSNCIAGARDRRRAKGRLDATHHRQPLPAARACPRNALSTMTDPQPHAS